MIKSPVGEDCIRLSKDVNSSEEIYKFSQLMNSNGLKITFNNTYANSSIPNLDYIFEIIIECDTTAKNPVFSTAEIDAIKKTVIIRGKAKESCPIYQPNPYIQKIIGFKYLYVVLAFVLGLIECFYGFKLFKPTLFVVKDLF